MNRRPLLFAMIVSLIISYFMYKNLMEKQKVDPNKMPPLESLIPKIPTKPVVVAKIRIPAKTRLEDPYIREALEVKQMNASDVPVGAFDNIASVTDRYTAITVLPNDVITTERLLDKKVVPNLSFAIPEGKRAYTVMVDKVRGVAGFIQQGDIVDIVGFFKQGGETEPVSRIVLQDLPVLAVGQTYEFDSAVATTAPTINAAKFDLVTLAVDPTHIEYLSLLVNNNIPFQLVLKNPNEKGKVAETKGATQRIVMTAVGIMPHQLQAAPPAEPKPEVSPQPEPVATVAPPKPPEVFVLPSEPKAEPEKIEISYGVNKQERYKEGLDVVKTADRGAAPTPAPSTEPPAAESSEAGE